MARYRCSDPGPRRLPWTEAEDDKLRDMVALGLCHEVWVLALPNRVFGEVATRRLDLGLRRRDDL